MARLVDWIQTSALGFGAPGLFIAALLDSSFLSLPEINDFLLVWMTTRHKSRMVLYATSATLGSTTGCLLLYYLGLKTAFVRARFSSDAMERALRTLRRHGLAAVLIPSLLPPPAPFKVFVLLAGVAEISASRFTAAVIIGRSVRFFGEGLLAVKYGDRTLDFISANSGTISIAVAILITAAIAGYVVWLKTQGRRAG